MSFVDQVFQAAGLELPDPVKEIHPELPTAPTLYLSSEHRFVPKTPAAERTRSIELKDEFYKMAICALMAFASMVGVFVALGHPILDALWHGFSFTTLFFVIPSSCICLDIYEAAGIMSIFPTALLLRLCVIDGTSDELIASFLALLEASVVSIFITNRYAEPYCHPSYRAYVCFSVYLWFLLVRASQEGYAPGVVPWVYPFAWIAVHVGALFMSGGSEKWMSLPTRLHSDGGDT
mmetsp:Transcript_37771/g.62631  ORF Transcript_37771/g.62631 Transcript_37771/m.62631 type:complete len:235 (-) Transcript_37771:96-800(-)|eukprot:CAMPEP_0184347576 /NCGR_PEP_ID=MMETSP1089-20130417/18766_1 /TAXON_ID=38269 ORGANISM="Gloeochaete wittrockiana, Strain SAG46.84" /NCGR_SAMPLE_ID=MMETSP1089 /ASSEMBLY_ACC=CAM_ASM_000445 /LENGTH=234 /DNA_ID=CAMNT_0026678709 /DNA_START=129 /DNA_END=833 /DNA_ORIENTATION=+